ncbi:MAG TPA: hypothetical protein VN758_05005 [Solirubrobacterales bacterium]|nr:hypothetical protein [Solirubrobacterales bacterium]
MKRLRALKEYGPAAAGPMLVAVGGAAAALTALLPPVAAFALVGAGVVGTGATIVDKVRRERWGRRARLKEALVHHPPKRASNCDRHDLGIDRSSIVTKKADENGDRQPYIPRDADDELDRALGSDHFVVVRGASKAGKSRSAFEAILRCDDPLLFAARKKAAVADIAENVDLLPRGPAILWLDKIDGYVRAGTFDTAVRDELLARGDLKIVGTIEDTAWSLTVKADGDAGTTYEAAEVLKSATEVRVERASVAEQGRAAELYPDEQFGASIGAHFVAASALRDRYLAGRDEETTTVRATADWQRTGMPNPIPKDVLQELHVHYLRGAVAEGVLEASIAWANAADGAGARLLHSHGSPAPAYSVPDHIVEWLTKSSPEKVKQAAWNLAIAEAGAGEAVAIGARALELHEREGIGLSPAQSAFERALEKSEPDTREKRVAATRLAMLMRRLKQDDLAEPYFQQAIDNGSMVAANNYGYMLMQHGSFTKAKPVLVLAVARGSRTAAFNLLQTLAELDEIDLAEELLRPHVEDNPAAALMLGNVHHRDDLEEADRLYALVREGSEDRDIGFRRRAGVLRALIAEQQGHPEEADSLYLESCEPDEWDLIAERLDHVGLVAELSELRQQIASRIAP